MQLRELLRETICTLADSGIDNARFEAEQLIDFCGIPRIKIISDPCFEVSDETAEKARSCVKKRLEGYPLQYIIGEWEFCGLPFKVGEGVLIPRQDTETLAEVCGDFLKDFPEGEILDICAGSGCLGITLAKQYGAKATLVELSEQAFGYLTENIALNNAEDCCKAILGDALEENTVVGEYDVVLSNPPYLTAEDMDCLQKEVTFEPKTALYGGEDGLDFYRRLLPLYVRKLRAGGLFAVEIGIHQERQVMEIFENNGIESYCEKDMCGIYRVVYGIKR